MLNALVGCLQAVGLAPSTVDQVKITQKAIRNTGLSDFGNGIHLEGMKQLTDSMNKEPLTHFAKVSSTMFGTDALSNRLRLVDYLKKHPEVNDIKIERPVFIVGFPRTGTTLVQNLLNLSEDRRALPFWEITNPVPVHADSAKDIELRQALTKKRLAVANFVLPEMKFIHEVRYDSLEECWPLMISQFTILCWDMTSRWPDYGKWMLQHDMRPSYEEYKKFLKIMVQREPNKKLILKCPDHMWYLDALLDAFPDACIVWTHRDPSHSLPSYCSLASLNWRLLYGEFDPKELGPYIEERFLIGIERALAVRDRIGEDRFLDINFSSLRQDPIAAINNITSYFNLTPVDEQLMRDHLSTERPDDPGKHSYSAGHYGLDTELIHEHYKDYIERFNISI